MLRKSWRRLAGFIAIECCLIAAPAEYRAGIGKAGEVKALVLEDRRGNRAAFAEAAFTVTRAVSDVAAARVMQALALDRAEILIRGGAGPNPRPEDVAYAILAAAVHLEPADVRFDGAKISVTAAGGRCLAAMFPLAFEQCGGGDAVRSPVRAAFQMVELTSGLLKRGQVTPSYPVQAIALGKQVTILGLGGDAPPAGFRAAGRLVVSFANDHAAWWDDPRVRAAVERLLERVK
jgi:hypothetical protein